jgi:hypothetical protein
VEWPVTQGLPEPGARYPARSLRDVARVLRDRVDALNPDERAWSMLRLDGEVHPWSAGAEKLFGGTEPFDGADDRMRHHRALCLHARAYDLQRTGEAAQALPYWRAAMREWAALHGSDEFWARLAERMPPIDGRPVPHDVVDAARRALPGHLLDVHVSLVRALRGTEPELATGHASLIFGSGFPPEAVAAARAALFAGLDARVAEALQQKRIGPIFDEVADWLRIDPTASEPAHLLVVLANDWALRLWQQTDGWTAVDNLLRRVDEILLPGGEVAAALADADKARLLFWRGVLLRFGTRAPRIIDSASEIGRIRRANERAERILQEALAHSSNLRLHPWVMNKHLAGTLSMQAECARLAGRDGDARRLAADAVALDPECKRAADLLDQLAAPAAPAVADEPAPDATREDSALREMVAVNEVAAIDRFLDRDEPVQALEQFEYLEQLRTEAASRRELAEHPAVARLGAGLQRHPTRRRRFHEVLARLRGTGEERDMG